MGLLKLTLSVDVFGIFFFIIIHLVFLSVGIFGVLVTRSFFPGWKQNPSDQSRLGNSGRVTGVKFSKILNSATTDSGD